MFIVFDDDLNDKFRLIFSVFFVKIKIEKVMKSRSILFFSDIEGRDSFFRNFVNWKRGSFNGELIFLESKNFVNFRFEKIKQSFIALIGIFMDLKNVVFEVTIPDFKIIP